MDQIYSLARLFKALGDETRLNLVILLSQQESGNAFCVGRLARELDTSISNVSQHLRVLKDLGLVRGERRGYRIHYFLDQERMADYQELARALLGQALRLRSGQALLVSANH
jgi:DNA-binding transcriptional ArsR family regulator